MTQTATKAAKVVVTEPIARIAGRLMTGLVRITVAPIVQGRSPVATGRVTNLVVTSRVTTRVETNRVTNLVVTSRVSSRVVGIVHAGTNGLGTTGRGAATATGPAVPPVLVVATGITRVPIARIAGRPMTGLARTTVEPIVPVRNHAVTDHVTNPAVTSRVTSLAVTSRVTSLAVGIVHAGTNGPGTTGRGVATATGPVVPPVLVVATGIVRVPIARMADREMTGLARTTVEPIVPVRNHAVTDHVTNPAVSSRVTNLVVTNRVTNLVVTSRVTNLVVTSRVSSRVVGIVHAGTNGLGTTGRGAATATGPAVPPVLAVATGITRVPIARIAGRPMTGLARTTVEPIVPVRNHAVTDHVTNPAVISRDTSLAVTSRVTNPVAINRVTNPVAINRVTNPVAINRVTSPVVINRDTSPVVTSRVSSRVVGIVHAGTNGPGTTGRGVATATGPVVPPVLVVATGIVRVPIARMADREMTVTAITDRSGRSDSSILECSPGKMNPRHR